MSHSSQSPSCSQALRNFSTELAGTGTYCSDYIKWRNGEAKGAKGEPIDLINTVERERWQWRSTVSYWVAVTFCWGAAVFTVASAFWFDAVTVEDSTEYMDSCVGLPFIIGCIIFVVGCYLGFFEVINSDPTHSSEQKKTILWISYSELKRRPEYEGIGDLFYSYTGSLAYFVGAVIYMVGCLAGVSYVSTLCTTLGMSLTLFTYIGQVANTLGGDRNSNPNLS